MEKDIKLLMTTQDRKVFDEEAKKWPGVGVFAEHTHNCVCTDPNCLMKCIQSIGRWFGSQKTCEGFFNDAALCTSDEELKMTMSSYAVIDPIFAENLERAYEAQMNEGGGVSQRAETEKKTVH